MGFLSKLFKGALGMDDSAEKAARAAAKRAERELEAQRQAQLLNAQNEMQGSTEITIDANTFGRHRSRKNCRFHRRCHTGSRLSWQGGGFVGSGRFGLFDDSCR